MERRRADGGGGARGRGRLHGRGGRHRGAGRVSAPALRLWAAEGAGDRAAFSAAVARGHFETTHLVAFLDTNDAIVDVALRFPPNPLLIASGGDATSRAALLAWFLAHDPDLDRMMGPLPEVAEAAEWWARASGVAAHRRFHQGVYALHAVIPAQRAAGALRLATEADRPVVAEWLQAFMREALHETSDTGDAQFTSFVKDRVRRLYLWTTVAGDVVAMAGRNGRTPSGVRIGAVYTPPALRGRGYGEALVAAASQRVLDEGAQACYLFTDLDYGASNRIYLRIGYVQVGEAAEMGFKTGGN